MYISYLVTVHNEIEELKRLVNESGVEVTAEFDRNVLGDAVDELMGLHRPVVKKRSPDLTRYAAAAAVIIVAAVLGSQLYIYMTEKPSPDRGPVTTQTTTVTPAEKLVALDIELPRAVFVGT